jgi:hypothetical protein
MKIIEWHCVQLEMNSIEIFKIYLKKWDANRCVSKMLKDYGVMTIGVERL